MLNILLSSEHELLPRLARKLFSRWLPDSNLIVTDGRASTFAINSALLPDILIVDISVPTRTCLAFLQRLRAENSAASILLLCNRTYKAYFDLAAPTGIVACLDIEAGTFVDDLRTHVLHIVHRQPSTIRGEPLTSNG